MKELLGIVIGAFLVCMAVLSLVMSPLVLPLGLSSVGSTNPPGVVPQAAVLPPMGPSVIDGAPLLGAIAPWLGTRYVFGGNTRAGVDCSGFTLAIYRDVFHVLLPRTAQTQYNATQHPAQPAVGDLVFFAGTYDSRPDFISHVGIYIGDGWMISAVEPTLGRQDLNSTYWRQHFVAFGRLPNG